MYQCILGNGLIRDFRSVMECACCKNDETFSEEYNLSGHELIQKTARRFCFNTSRLRESYRI